MTPEDEKEHDKKWGKTRRRLHGMAVHWLMDRANPEDQGGMGVFADTRFCMDLTKLRARSSHRTQARTREEEEGRA